MNMELRIMRTEYMKTGASVVFLQDWAVNAEIEKFFDTRDRALLIINYLRTKDASGTMRGRIL